MVPHNLAYTNAIMDSVPKFEDRSRLFHRIAEKLFLFLAKFKLQELSNMVWSFEKVGASNPP